MGVGRLVHKLAHFVMARQLLAGEFCLLGGGGLRGTDSFHNTAGKL